MLGALTQTGVLGRHLSELMSQLRGERVARQRGRGGPGGRNGSKGGAVRTGAAGCRPPSAPAPGPSSLPPSRLENPAGTSRSRPLLGMDGRQPGTAAVCRGHSGPRVLRAATSPRQSHVAAD